MSTFKSIRCYRKETAGIVAASCSGLPKRRIHHSPDGYEFGYGGSGPADLALNILAAVLPRRDPEDRDRVRLHDRSWVSERVWQLHQHLKWELIARLPRAGFTLSRQDVLDWVNTADSGERAELCRRIIAREANTAADPQFDPAYENEIYCPACESHPCAMRPSAVLVPHAPPVSPPAALPLEDSTMTNRSQSRAKQDREHLERAVAALRDSATWKCNLAILARFPRYSVNNQFLIAHQKPEATYVRGFKSWLDAGRAVRKGERGIAIFAPRPWHRTHTGESGDDVIEAGISFAIVHVFDVSQTDPIPGHPDPWQPPARHAATGDESLAWELWHAMMEHAAILGLSVSTSAAESLGDVYGSYHPDVRAIWVRPGRDRADMAATLAHELAHAVTHDAAASMSRETREVVAESVAYAVCTRFGLDLELRSTHYVATWLDDPEAFRVGMAAIHNGAAALIDAIEAEFLDADVLQAAA